MRFATAAALPHEQVFAGDTGAVFPKQPLHQPGHLLFLVELPLMVSVSSVKYLGQAHAAPTAPLCHKRLLKEGIGDAG